MRASLFKHYQSENSYTEYSKISLHTTQAHTQTPVKPKPRKNPSKYQFLPNKNGETDFADRKTVILKGQTMID